MIIEKIKIEDLKPNPINPRKSDITQEKNLKESLTKFGVVEPIIYNKQTKQIVGGHFRVRELKKLGVKEVDCVIVDLSQEDENELNIRLNANTGDWDLELLESDWNSEDLEDWGLNVLNNIEIDDAYTTKVESPVYEPKKDKPIISNLYNKDKYDELVNEIKQSDILKEDKDFLLIAAKRHIEFNYAEIAEYYAHSGKSTQELMENSALVIIDYNKAIEKGFVKLYEQVENLTEIDE